jgi:hypothetical protein
MNWRCPACGHDTLLYYDKGDPSVGVGDSVEWGGCACGHSLTSEEEDQAYDYAKQWMEEERGEAQIDAYLDRARWNS